MALNISPLEGFALAADAVYLKSRPLPTAPDGKYDPPSQEPGKKQERSALGGVLKRLDARAKKGVVVPDPKVVAGFIDGVVNSDASNDRLGAFAAGLTLLSQLPPDSDVAKKLSDNAIGMLYNTLPHPIETLLDGEYKFRQADAEKKFAAQQSQVPLDPYNSFRQADGGNNNLQIPDYGRAGTPYARSVQNKWCVAQSELPDPGLVFDTLLRRKKPVEHPNGSASFTFAFASLVTHSLFRSRPGNWNINDTSSYLDLTPLYGISQETQDLVRNKELGRGLLYPDTFSEERLLFLPPCASALLVILSRNHNFIAEKLLRINERGRWTDPPPEDPAKRAQQDEEIFQTARLVNGGHFMSLIMGDYVSGFLGLSEGNAWNMNAFDPITTDKGIEVNRGEGNHCSVEFNILYRWHATTSEADAKWIDDFFREQFPEIKQPIDITVPEFGKKFLGILQNIEKDPKKRTFGGMTRDSEGRFPDDQLANILQTATENPACSFGAHGTPDALKCIEIMGIMQARQWGLCTMNEFRKFLKLKPFESFDEWNPDPAVYGPAQRLYKHIDNLELYTGLQCESIMPLSGGLRFACGYTTTRAVLSDAIALIRGDRYYTTAFTPANLTTWGYQDCLRDPNNGGFGGEMPKLLSRHLSRYYPYNSVYTCFPFFTPGKMKNSLTTLGMADKYTFERPKPGPVVKVLNTMTAIKNVFNKPLEFPVVYDMKGLGGGYGFMLTFDEAKKHDADRNLASHSTCSALHALFPTKDSLNEYRKWYRDQVSLRINQRSFKFDGVPGKWIDVVNDVINSTSIAWASERLCGLDMKTKENPSGMYTEAEIYEMFTTMFTLIFLAIGDNEHGFSLRKQVLQAGGVTQAMIAKNVFDCAPKAAGASNVLLGAISTVASTVHSVIDNKPCYPFLRRLAETGRPINEIVAMVVGLAVGSSVNYAQAAVHVVDFYMDKERDNERAEIIKLAQSKDSEGKGWDTLVGYVREAMRFNPQVTGLYRDVLVDTVIDQGEGFDKVELKKGDRVFGSLKNAHLNPQDFPEPLKINPNRPASDYSYNGSGFHKCPGVGYAEQTIAEIVKVVFSLPNIRRAPGNDGRLAGFEEIQNETKTKVYLTSDGGTSPWPGSMYLVYDA